MNDDDAIDLEEACPDCIDCKAPLSLVEGGEWPEIGPVCYGCLADRHDALRAEVERLTPREMTIYDACEVMNQFKYLGQTNWKVNPLGGWNTVECSRFCSSLHERTAVYIAQGLERDAKGGG